MIRLTYLCKRGPLSETNGLIGSLGDWLSLTPISHAVMANLTLAVGHIAVGSAFRSLV